MAVRALNPQTNPPGWIAAASALYAAGTAIYNWDVGKGPIDWSVVFAAIVAVAALWSRTRTTPLADPRDGAGRVLVPQGMPPPAPPGTEPPYVQKLRDVLTEIPPAAP